MKDAFEWNRENLQNLLNNYSLLLKSPLRANLPYCVYLISFTGFVSYLSQWMTYKIECDDRKPHPFLFKGKFVKDSITCNPEEQCFETIDPKIHTLTDIRKSVHLASVTSSRFARYGNKEAIHTRKQWLSYNDVRLSEAIADIVTKYSRTDAPLCIIGDFSSIKCCSSAQRSLLPL